MTILQIEHPVRDFDGWKRAFDSDPVGRSEGGVVADAEAFLERLRGLWRRVVEQGLISDPQARILDLAESAGV